MRIIALLFLILFISVCYSQIPLGSWRTHLSYNYGIQVQPANNYTYCLTKGGLFEYNVSDNSVRALDKVYGLSDVSIVSIRYIEQKEALIIGYDNGNIDVIKNGQIRNISDIKQKPIIGNKSINCIEYFNGKVYLGCGFGIVVIDIDKNEVRETFMIGDNASNVEVQDIAFTDSRIYAATSNGIYYASLSGTNLANFHNWNKELNVPNYDKKFKHIAWFNQKLYVAYKSTNFGEDKIYVLDNGNWVELDTTIHVVKNMQVSQNQLIIADESVLRVIQLGSDVIQQIWLQWVYPNDAAFDVNGNLWIADTYGGLAFKKKNSDANEIKWIKPNGPLFVDVMKLDAAANNVWATAGGTTSSLNNQWKGAAMYHFKDDEWTTVYQYSHPLLNTVVDVCQVKINPNNPNQVYFGSFGSGLIKITNGIVDTVFNYTNSPLETIIPDQPYVRITGLDFDNDGNLWIALSEVDHNVVVLKKDGSWNTFNLTVPMGGKKILGNILCTSKGVKWIIFPKGGGLFAFSENGTITNTSDDKYKKVSIISPEGEEISNDVFCMKEDKNGLLWVGTAKGLVYYYNQENVFETANFYAQRIKLPNEIEGQANYLFESEVITALTIDGANRKWVGTLSGGVFLMSEDCTRELLHFTIDNSPLLSNTINDIAIDPVSGEVFFATDKGICSYRGTATEGNEFHHQVEVFPNPVKSDYHGIIAIRGLVSNAYVKITDVAGNLVYETRAEGGQAVWNGKNLLGQRVQTGVYFIFSTNEDGSEKFVTKLLFIH